MEYLIGVLEETPWWVYGIFIYLLWKGIKAMQPGTISIHKLIIFPAILTVWGFITMTWTFAPVFAWSLMLALGFCLGWLSVRQWKVRYDRKRGTLHLPGSWTTLALAMIFFSIKYFFGFYAATHTEIPLELNVAQSAAGGIITGMFIGRLAYFWKRYEEI